MLVINVKESLHEVLKNVNNVQMDELNTLNVIHIVIKDRVNIKKNST